MGLTNQLFTLSKGIHDAIDDRCNVVVIDRFLCDYSNHEYVRVSDVLDLEKMNVYFREKYGLVLVDRHGFDFELLSVTYGTVESKVDVTRTVKEKYYRDKKLFISRLTDLNDIQGDPFPGLRKHIWFEYRLNGDVIVDKYEEHLARDIDYTNNNYAMSPMGWPSKNHDTFEDILTHITYTKQFYDVSRKQLSGTALTSRVNLVHLRVEEDAINHWSRMNGMSKEDFRVELENRYIQLVRENINESDTTIVLSSSSDNGVIDFLDENGYNYFASRKSFRHRELNAIVDFIISKQCNNVFIGNFDFDGMNGSSFSYYVKVSLHSDVTYERVDLDHVLVY